MMKAVQFYGKEDLRFEDVPEPQTGPGQIKVQPAYAGICGSDLHFYFYPEALPFPLDQPHPLTGAQLPQILGHEFSGVVTEIGEGVHNVHLGDKVAVFPLAASCGTCKACLSDHPFACLSMGSTGATAPGGGMSGAVVIQAEQAHILPENVDLKLGALVEPMTVAWHAVAQSRADKEHTALILGAGPIGIGAWFALKARGVSKILVSEPNEQRRNAIAALGATVADPLTDDLFAALSILSGGAGADVVIDAAGASAALVSGQMALNPGGRLVIVALHEKPVELPLTHLMMAETEIIGAVGYSHREFDEVIEAMGQGIYTVDGWVEERPLAEAEKSILELRQGTGAKVLLRSSR